MQGQNTPKAFSDDYIEQCFQVWYTLGQPTNITLLQEAIPESPDGKKPGLPLLRQFRDTNGWIERADGLNAIAIGKAEIVLTDKRAEMFIRQIDNAVSVGELAKNHLLSKGFDTSASAVSALKWAQEEERTIRGVSDFEIKLSKMNQDELIQEAAKLLKRNSEVIDGETAEEENADSYSTATED